jgi:hypothetical protein
MAKIEEDDEAKEGEPSPIHDHDRFEDLQNVYKFGFSSDPTDKHPYEFSARCYYCQASFSLENQVKNFLQSGKVIGANQQNIKMINKHCQCGKSIPGCAVCLAPIGIMNYQVELQKSKSK